MILKIETTQAVLLVSPFSQTGGRIFSLLKGGAEWLRYGNGIKFPPTEENMKIIHSQVSDLVIEDLRTKETEWEGFDATSSLYVPKTELRPYQKEALRKIGSKSTFALFMEVGTGKTKVAIDWAGLLFAQKKITAVVVIAPKGVHRQWIESAYPTHSGSDYFGSFWPIKEVTKDMLPGPSIKIFAINWDAIITPRGVKILESFISLHKNKVLFVADESHSIKNYRSKRSKVIRSFKDIKYRMILTGTPTAKNLEDEWAQFLWLNSSILGISYVTHFRNEYCMMGGFQGKNIIGHKNVSRYREKIDPYVYIITKKDIGQYPASIENWYFDLNPEQKGIIHNIKTEQIATLDNDEFDVANAMVAVNKSQQISNGFYMDEGKVIWSLPEHDNPRLTALKEFLDSREEEKVIIWATYREDIRAIRKLLGSTGVVYEGDNRGAALSAFLDPNGECTRFLANPATAGTGIDGLQNVCTTDIFYSMNDNYIQKVQAEGRIDRVGQKYPVTHYYLIGRGSFDSKILYRHKRKKDIYSMVHGEWEKFFKADEDDEVWSDQT